MPNASVSSKGAPQMSPRGTERVRRRTEQAQHAVQAQAEGAALTSPSGPEKDAAIKRNQEAQVARFGPSKQTRTRALQAENKRQSETEAVTLSHVPDNGRPVLPPIGTQVDLLTANTMARRHDTEERDMLTDAAKAAGLAVRESLRGKVPQVGPESRMRHVVQHNAQADVLARRAAEAVKQ